MRASPRCALTRECGGYVIGTGREVAYFLIDACHATADMHTFLVFKEEILLRRLFHWDFSSNVCGKSFIQISNLILTF